MKAAMLKTLLLMMALFMAACTADEATIGTTGGGTETGEPPIIGVGEKGGPCYNNGTCNAPLVCQGDGINGICVDAPTTSETGGEETQSGGGACTEDLVTTGILSNNVQVIDYSGQVTTADIGHRVDDDATQDGCIARVALTLSYGGQGCEFTAVFEVVPGFEWLKLTSATLNANSFCPGWTAGNHGVYAYNGQGDFELSFPDDVVSPQAPTVCFGANMAITGEIAMVSGGKQIVVGMNGFKVDGTFLSTGDASLACPSFPGCNLTTCETDIDCQLCEDDKNICIDEFGCAQCDPQTNQGCAQGWECTSFGVCEESVKPCPTVELEDGTFVPDVTCYANADCANCSPLNQVCDGATNKCVACTADNTTHCLKSDICVAGNCQSPCPSTCEVDNDCSECVGKGDLQAKACFEHQCSQCSETYPCPSGKECESGVCVPLCGILGVNPAGSCQTDNDCLFCGGNLGGVVNEYTWGCNFPINGATFGKCGPPATGCSDLGNGVAVLPEPWSDYTQACSSDQNCINQGAGIQYNVGQLLKDMVGDEPFGLEIQDAEVFYPMSVCKDVSLSLSNGNDVSCGICVPCEVDADCGPIDLDPIIGQLFPISGIVDFVVQVAIQQLLNNLYGAGVEHQLHFFCQNVTAGVGVCAPCSKPNQACGSSGGGNHDPNEGGTCSHSVCEDGGPLNANCGACEAAVCSADSYCCDTAWDFQCVTAVENHCTVSCNGGTIVNNCAHGACETGAALDANCSDCVQSVCDLDPFCCNNSWDSNCASCAEGNPGFGNADCSVPGLLCAGECQGAGETGGGCTPDCAGKTCGDNGCGGSCGECGNGFCVNGICFGGSSGGGDVDECAFDECTTSLNPLEDGCNECVSFVCDLDSFCCNPDVGKWDENCVKCASGENTPFAQCSGAFNAGCSCDVFDI